MEPRQLVQEWVACFNQADADALADLYAEDATNHQVIRDPVVGRAAIRAMFAREFGQASMVCQVENIFQDGDWAILEWADPNGYAAAVSSGPGTIKSYFSEATSTNCRFFG